MSIRKAKIFLKAKLKKHGKKLVAKTQHKEIILNSEKFKLLSLIDGKRRLQDLADLTKKSINRILKNIIEPEESGVIELRLSAESPDLKALYERRSSIDAIYRKQPAFSNIIAYEREWGIYPSVLDFLDKRSENYKLKNFEKEIYLDIIRPFLDKIPKYSQIIDAGGGIGRFAVPLARMRHMVHVVDTSEIALKKALRHFLDENLDSFDLHWADAGNLSMFSDNTFDAALAIELVCYSDKPARVLKELVRVTKKNGLIIISVEGKYGGMFSESNVSLDKISSILQNDLLYIKNHLYVHYYTPASLKRLLEKCGIKIIDIFGSHYVTDGIFHRLINIDKLDDKDYRKDVFKIEKLCRNDPVLKNLARALVAVGRKS